MAGCVKIVSWQIVLTDHQVYTMRALQDVSGEPLTIISGVKELEERQLQGWTSPDISGLHVQYLPRSGWWREGLDVLRKHQNAIHMFNGLWGDRRFFFLLIEAQRRGIKTALMTEPYAEVAVGYLSEDSHWRAKAKAFLRPLVYKFVGGLVARRFIAVFAISEKAIEQCVRMGVGQEKVFPFGYFVPAIQCDSPTGIETEEPPVKLVFVGSLIQRKGIQILVEAMRISRSACSNILLDVYGSGDETQLTGVMGVSYKGLIPFGNAQKVIARYDALVLPSLHDGWGVVVNEALLQGVPVLVSDQVGAKTLVEKSGAGIIIKAGDKYAWGEVFEHISVDCECLKLWKLNAISYKEQLSPEIAAQYLYDGLQHALGVVRKKIKNPWYII